jgi:stage IV sporulation protein B
MFLMIKKFKNMIWAIILTLLVFPTTAFAYSDYIIPGGENIGIQINTKGILIVGLYKVGDRSPGRDAGLKIGDKILEINNTKVVTINDLVNAINNDPNKDSILITYERNNKTYQTPLKLVKGSDNVYKTGLYVKDTINGVGTLTYIDPETKLFGALGHEIIERSSGQMIEVKDGKIFKSEVLNIDKSTNGAPGKKRKIFSSYDLW